MKKLLLFIFIILFSTNFTNLLKSNLYFNEKEKKKIFINCSIVGIISGGAYLFWAKKYLQLETANPNYDYKLAIFVSLASMLSLQNYYKYLKSAADYQIFHGSDDLKKLCIGILNFIFFRRCTY